MTGVAPWAFAKARSFRKYLVLAGSICDGLSDGIPARTLGKPAATFAARCAFEGIEAVSPPSAEYWWLSTHVDTFGFALAPRKGRASGSSEISLLTLSMAIPTSTKMRYAGCAA